MKKLLIPLAIALVAGCAATAETAKSQASPSGEKSNMMAVMKHVSPMPNLMPITIGNADMLELSKEQTEALVKGRNERHDKVHALANEIIADEKSVTQAALQGKSKQEINTMSEAIMKKRLAIIDAKAGCRDTLREVLNEDQWNEVIELAKASKN